MERGLQGSAGRRRRTNYVQAATYLAFGRTSCWRRISMPLRAARSVTSRCKPSIGGVRGQVFRDRVKTENPIYRFEGPREKKHPGSQTQAALAPHETSSMTQIPWTTWIYQSAVESESDLPVRTMHLHENSPLFPSPATSQYRSTDLTAASTYRKLRRRAANIEWQ